MALTASFLRQALDEPLRPFGFERLGRRPIWMREVAGLEHAVTVFSRHRMRSTEWYVIHPKVGEILHGKRTDRTDVGYANLIRGSANPHSRPGAKGDFTDADLADDLDATIEGVAAAALFVAEWTERFMTVQQTMETREPQRVAGGRTAEAGDTIATCVCSGLRF